MEAAARPIYPKQALGDSRRRRYGIGLSDLILFTTRQLVALDDASAISSSRRAERVLADVADDRRTPTRSRLTWRFAVSRLADYSTRTRRVESEGGDQSAAPFARQALPMVWDFAEANPLRDGQLAILAVAVELGRGCA